MTMTQRPCTPVPVAIRAFEQTQTLRVAIAGCGTVGGALAAQLLAAGSVAGRTVHIASVLVRDVAKPRTVSFPRGVVTGDLADFLRVVTGLLSPSRRRDCDVVIEAIGGIEPGRTIVATALTAGRRVVTANKALLAAHGAELAALAERGGGQLDFEGAVGAGIPVVRSLRSGAAGIGVQALRGVLNGTSNFVLSRVREGVSFDRAVRDAQAAGFAERDPSRDLDGRDAGDKVALLAWLAFGVAPHMLAVRRRPLDDAVVLAGAAKALDATTIQLAECVRTPAGLVASVEPAVAPLAHPLGRVTGECNAVTVDSDSAGTIVFSGRGAGGDPTAGALHADLGATSGPLPAPRITAIASRDGRDLGWLLWSRSGDRLVSEAAAAPVRREEAFAHHGWALYAFTGTPTAAASLADRLRVAGDEPSWARDLR